MNSTERAYELHLIAQLAAGEIDDYRYEPIKLRLADRTYYTPDFMVQRPDGTLEFHEVKGFWRDDARVKIKIAGQMFPEFRFIAAVRQGNGWKIERFS